MLGARLSSKEASNFYFLLIRQRHNRHTTHKHGEETNEAELEMVDLSGSRRMRDAQRRVGVRSAGSGPSQSGGPGPSQRISQVVYGQERPAARAVPRHGRR